MFERRVGPRPSYAAWWPPWFCGSLCLYVTQSRAGDSTMSPLSTAHRGFPLSVWGTGAASSSSCYSHCAKEGAHSCYVFCIVIQSRIKDERVGKDGNVKRDKSQKSSGVLTPRHETNVCIHGYLKVSWGYRTANRAKAHTVPGPGSRNFGLIEGKKQMFT